MWRYCRLFAIVTAFVLLLTACGGAGAEIEDELPPVSDEQLSPEESDVQFVPDKSAVTPEPDAQTVPDTTPEPDAELVPDTTPEPDAESVPNTTPEPDAESVPNTTPEPDAQTVPDTESDTASEPDDEAHLSGGLSPEVNIVGEGIHIGQLSYDVRPDSCTVYVSENGVYVPFLVLTADYGGNTLLLRRDVLPDAQAFNTYSAAYPDSAIDRYLNSEYVQTLDAVRPLIQSADIVVTAPDALGVSGDAVQTIEREIFLLSCTETGFTNLVNAGKEGNTLSYFADPAHRTASRENGTAVSWWLRTPDTYYLSAAYGIGADGSLGSGNAYNENGIRPAFRVPSDADAFPTTDIVQGQTVYFLSA
ncbi:MAG: hypothetical protein IJR72_04530 [Oscillospiraceae bacterium]|nr:hypothetical protein [Oscillospiraceae bacterium]